MNNSEIIAKTFELREKLLNSEVYKILKEKEKEMVDNEECFKLLSDFQCAKDKYNDAKRFEKYGGNIEESQRELSKIKRQLSENKYVKTYNEAYRKMIEQLRNIEKIIFKDIIKERKEIKIE